MENQGHTRIKKAQRSIKLYLSDSVRGSIFKSTPLVEFSKSPLNSDFSIHQNDDLYEVFTGGTIVGDPVLIVSTATNYQTIYKLLNSNSKLISEFRTKRNKKKLFKASSILKSNSSNLKSFIDILEFKAYLQNQSSKIFDTSDIPEYILKSKLYKGYKSCQIMIHEKGSPLIGAYYFDSSVGLRKNEIPVTTFSKLFNLVKKSKNKLFNQSQILESDIGVVGTFLAKEIELKKHSILVIISRNDFLPPSDIEINLFNSSMTFVSDVFQNILLTSLEKRKTESYMSFLANYPFPLFLDETPLNEAARSFDLSSTDEDEISIEVAEKKFIEINDSFKKNTSDIYHHQRVSLLGELLNTLKHELSNPLFGLKMASDLLQLEEVDEDFSSTVNDISINCNRCQTIIDNFSKLYREENINEIFNISDVLNETILLTKSESKQIPKQINFYNFQSDEDYLIKSNPTWISQIIFNLIINSCQAIKSAGQELSKNNIEITIIKKLEEIEFSVSDSGPGIPKKLRDQIFEPFVTTKEKGTGLGLSICSNLINKLNGKIEIIDKDEIGTVVVFTLPIDD
ncbi:hypothetical protein A9Q84_21215 [Halobacteriovorax marinus]|uniref:histidine kinase n=1 Tax=Halobacteriovorax marinus TaxID=97084 RepID=A0A1Y5F274_9BACT|nr:hypothetical protein A9Q84_21215 [Halobacteriovorax marinus]